MDDSILAKFPDDASVLGPFLGNLPPEILDAVVEKFGWFQATSFAMAGRTCREAVGRAGASARVMSRLTCTCAARDGDLEALRRARRKGCPWGEHTCAEAANGGDLRDASVGASERVPVGREGRARWRRREATWRCFGGRARTGASGTR